MYGNAGPGYIPNNYPGDQEIMGVNFGSPTYHNSPTYNIHPQAQGYNIPFQSGYPGVFNPNQNYPGGNIYPVQPNIGYHQNNFRPQNGFNGQQNPNGPKKDYDQLVTEIQSGVINIAINEEQKKQDLAQKQKQDEQDKYFNFIKF